MEGNIKIVIGSWGSYNECNERALGSKWLDLSDYSDWDEIREELKKEGFELDGIDEELFIQDVEGIEDRSVRNFIREVILYKDKVVITFNFTDQHITKKRLPDSIEEVERTAKQAEKSASKNKSGVYKNASTPPSET